MGDRGYFLQSRQRSRLQVDVRAGSGPKSNLTRRTNPLDLATVVSTVLAIDTGQKEHAQNLPKQSQVETRTRELGPLQATERAKVRAAAIEVNQVTPRRTDV